MWPNIKKWVRIRSVAMILIIWAQALGNGYDDDRGNMMRKRTVRP